MHAISLKKNDTGESAVNRTDKTKGHPEICRSCNHFEFCMVCWGRECKRQGGNRTPKLKSSTVPGKRADKSVVAFQRKQPQTNVPREKADKPAFKPEFMKPFLGTEKISTKVVEW